VAVSGIGVLSVFGNSHDEFRDGLLLGRTGVASIAAFDAAECRTTLAAPLAGFTPGDWVPAMKLRRMDRTGVYGVAATRLALEDAQASIPVEGAESIGVVLGTSTAGGQSTHAFLDGLFRGGVTGAPVLLFDSTVGNSAQALPRLNTSCAVPTSR